MALHSNGAKNLELDKWVALQAQYVIITGEGGIRGALPGTHNLIDIPWFAHCQIITHSMAHLLYHKKKIIVIRPSGYLLDDSLSVIDTHRYWPFIINCLAPRILSELSNSNVFVQAAITCSAASLIIVAACWISSFVSWTFTVIRILEKESIIWDNSNTSNWWQKLEEQVSTMQEGLQGFCLRGPKTCFQNLNQKNRQPKKMANMMDKERGGQPPLLPPCHGKLPMLVR